jgi:hypothetical protein
MEVIDSQEFVAQDILTTNSQSIIDTDTSTLPGSAVGDELKSEQLTIADSAISISEQQIETETLSSQTGDIVQSGGEVTQRQENSQFTQQSDALTGANYATTGSGGNNQSLLKNSGFESPIDGTNWLVGKTGKVQQYDQNVGSVAYVANVPGQGKQMHLTLPEEAKINYQDQLSIFQDVSGLETNKIYSVEARVRWMNPENNLPSAIVSFWAKNPDNSFRGRDFTITDGNGYKNLKFEFTPAQAGSTRFFMGLFTHINGNTDDTEIAVDDYKVTEVGAIPQGIDNRQGNLLKDGGFDRYTTQSRNNQNGWSYTTISPVSGLNQSVINVNGNKKLRLELPKAWSNNAQFNTSVTGVYQNVDLVGGHTYQLSADFQRTTFNQFSSQKDSIAQLIMYRKRPSGEDLFLGPIDVKLTNNGLISKNFSILAPDSGNYTILVRLAGWGNEGNNVAVNVDNVRLLT